MKTANLRQLRNETSTLLEWIESGETVVMTKRSKPILRLMPLLSETRSDIEYPDFAARQSAIFGDQRLPQTAAEMLAEERGRY